MKKYIIFTVTILILLSATASLWKYTEHLKSDRDRLIKNQDILQKDIDRYVTADSLKAVSVRELSFTLNEYKKYRSEDLQTIKTLKNDVSRLQSVSKTQLQTIYGIQNIEVRDSIVYRDKSVPDTLHCISYEDPYLTFSGCYDKKKFNGNIESRDSLIITEHIIPKRFLGFLWKYGVKERRHEIVSNNPHTEIINAEWITIRK
jgi:hypothetical protein